jgi:hypothetical protein
MRLMLRVADEPYSLDGRAIATRWRKLLERVGRRGCTYNNSVRLVRVEKEDLTLRVAQ